MNVPRLILTDHHIYSAMPSLWKMSDFVQCWPRRAPELARTCRPANCVLENDVGHALRNTIVGFLKGK